MRKQSLLIAMFMVLAVSALVASFCLAAQSTKDEVIDQAKKALTDKGVVLEDVNIVYDEANRQWEAWGVAVAQVPSDPNHGLLPHGVLQEKKHQAVYFDFIDDAKKDIWVFVNLDTGEVLEVYEKK